MKIIIKMIFFTFFLIYFYCAQIPEHTNPFDPDTPNDPPSKISLDPATSVRVIQDDYIEITWDSVEDDDFLRYEVWRADSSLANNFNLISIKIAAYSSSIEDNGLKPVSNLPSDIILEQNQNLGNIPGSNKFGLRPGTDYYYYVMVMDKGGKRTASSTLNVKTAIQSRGERLDVGEDLNIEEIFLVSKSNLLIFYTVMSDADENLYLGMQTFYADSLKVLRGQQNRVWPDSLGNFKSGKLQEENHSAFKYFVINKDASEVDFEDFDFTGLAVDKNFNLYLGFKADVFPKPGKTFNFNGPVSGILKFKRSINSNSLADYSLDTNWIASGRYLFISGRMIDDFIVDDTTLYISSGGMGGPKLFKYVNKTGGLETVVSQSNSGGPESHLNLGKNQKGDKILFVVNIDQDRIQPYNISLGYSSKNPLQFDENEGKEEISELVDIVIDTAGNIYVLDKTERRVVIFNAQRKFYSEWTNYSIDDESRLFYDGGENIFLFLDLEKKVHWFNLGNRKPERRLVPGG